MYYDKENMTPCKIVDDLGDDTIIICDEQFGERRVDKTEIIDSESIDFIKEGFKYLLKTEQIQIQLNIHGNYGGKDTIDIEVYIDKEKVYSYEEWL